MSRVEWACRRRWVLWRSGRWRSREWRLREWRLGEWRLGEWRLWEWWRGLKEKDGSGEEVGWVGGGAADGVRPGGGWVG